MPRGIDRAITLAKCEEFFGSVEDGGGIMIKAIAGEGGRGSRKVTARQDVAEAFAACQREATLSCLAFCCCFLNLSCLAGADGMGRFVRISQFNEMTQ